MTVFAITCLKSSFYLSDTETKSESTTCSTDSPGSDCHTDLVEEGKRKCCTGGTRLSF